MTELKIEAKTERLPDVSGWLEEQLEKGNCPPKLMMKLELLVEELFVNIASYAYGPEGGDAVFQADFPREGLFRLSIRDWGMPFDPLKKEDPDITLPAEKRDVGGLGVFLVKKLADRIDYAYTDGQNVVTIEKDLKV